MAASSSPWSAGPTVPEDLPSYVDRITIECVKTEGDVFAAARWLAEHGFSIELSMSRGEGAELCASPQMRIQGVHLPDRLDIREGDVLCAAINQHGVVRALGVVPALLAEPILAVADVIW